MSIRVMVNGAGGRMGKQVVQAVCQAADMELVAAVDPACAKQDVGIIAGLGELGIIVDADLDQAIKRTQPERVVDFTMPSIVMANARCVLSAGAHMVIGTTGLLEQNLQELDALARKHNVGVVHAPNFALGAVLMMRFAREAARFFPGVEIIELHHDQKRDAPSGTAIKTAEMIREVWQKPEACVDEELKLAGARGSDFDGVHIHSVRLPGLIAHQEVMFGGPGQTLTIRHDSLDRESFMPGVLLAIRKVADHQGLVYGLEHLLF
jgi:4-hydroxy-tetrahydrodipicolinate reductase